MVIYARLLPLSSLTSPSTSLQTASQLNRPLESGGRVVQLSVARLMPRPPEPHPRPRMPRPDDPIPRKPPLILLRGSKVVSAAKSALNKSTRELKRAASMGGSGVLTKRPRLDSQMSEFKIPDVPVKEGDVKGKGKGKEKERLGDEVDVFGTNVMNKGKVDGIGGEKRGREGGAGDGEGESEVESLNKTAIKKATVDFLAKTKDPTRAGVFVERSHPDFKEIFQWIYRGASFALVSDLMLLGGLIIKVSDAVQRGRMKNEVVEGSMILRLVRKHGEMYIGGLGGE
ncbi:hypothetical protein AMATHDRAFT_60990 [Amanita thiersii Skay4041]|uniref:Uncharacterized protein n=1 Tax=Amanita thiersii Skay4041 TaxID=703135 RepID=A0A2A9NIN5_9AGAR|nr:hypothetical protein AMATHDRAFT_60990 [Amanita thiersii Skay4041]